MNELDRIKVALRAILEAQLAASYKLSGPRGADVRKAVREAARQWLMAQLGRGKRDGKGPEIVAAREKE